MRQTGLHVVKSPGYRQVIHNRARPVNFPSTPEFVNIALVTETFPPEVNGVAMTLHRVVEGLHARGCSVEVVCPRRSDRDEMIATAPYHFEMVPGLPIPRYDGLRFGLPAKGRLVRRWRKSRPDLIHVATEGPLGWSAVRAARALGIPFVTTFHTNFHAYGSHYGYGFLKKTVLWWLQSIRRHAEATFVPSPALRKELEAAGFERLSILSRGVDTQLFAPAKRDSALRAQWGVGPETPVALYVGRVAGEKNLPLTFAAYAAMRAIRRDLKLVIVGDGPERRKLEAAHPEVIFAGMQRGENLARHYASGDCFLFASTTETFGNVITEAMASGLAVLSFDYAAAQTYLREGENGALAPFQDEEAFLARARQLARELDLWPVFGNAARKTALGISWDHILDQFHRELQAILRCRATPLSAVTSPSQSAV